MKNIVFISLLVLAFLYCSCTKEEPMKSPTQHLEDIQYFDFSVPHSDCVFFNDITFFKEIKNEYLTIRASGYFISETDTSQFFYLNNNETAYFKHVLHNKIYDYSIKYYIVNDTSYLSGDYKLIK